MKANATTRVLTSRSVGLPRLLSSTRFSGVQEILPGTDRESSALSVFDLRTGAVENVLAVRGRMVAYDWSPDRRSIAAVTVDRFGYPHLSVFIVESGTRRAIATLAPALGRHGTDDDQIRVEYSPRGDGILFVYTPADGDPSRVVPADQSQLQVRTPGGELVFAPAHTSGATMAAWSGDGRRVVFRSTGGAQAWEASTGRTVRLRNAGTWYSPWPSPDGRTVAYSVGSGARTLVRLYDLAGGRARDATKAGRGRPVVASAATLWVEELRACAECPGGVEGTGAVFAVDVRTGAERKIALSTLRDVDVLYA